MKNIKEVFLLFLSIIVLITCLHFCCKPVVDTQGKKVSPTANVVIKVQPKVTITKISPNSVTPSIKINPFKVIQKKNGKIEVQKIVTGSYTAGTATGDFTVEMESSIIQENTQLPFAVGLFGYYADKQVKPTVSLLYPVEIPFTEVKLWGGVGLDAVSLSYGFQLTDNSYAHIGMMYLYKNELAVFGGLSLNL